MFQKSRLSTICKIACLVATCQIAAFGPACAQSNDPTTGQGYRDPVISPVGVFDPPALTTLGQLVARLRLLTYNVYGADIDDCETRAETFGNKVAFVGTVRGRPFDIIGVQKYYEDHFFDFGTICDHDNLRDATLTLTIPVSSAQ